MRAIIIILHEFGHAVPALLFTKKDVTVYLGTYGSQHKSKRIKLKRLEVWMYYNPLIWRAGICASYQEKLSLRKQIICTIGGPMSSLFVACFTSFLIFSFDLHSLLKTFVVFFLIAAIVDLLENLIPNNYRILLSNGEYIYNDGNRLRELIRLATSKSEKDKIVNQ